MHAGGWGFLLGAVALPHRLWQARARLALLHLPHASIQAEQRYHHYHHTQPAKPACILGSRPRSSRKQNLGAALPQGWFCNSPTFEHLG